MSHHHVSSKECIARASGGTRPSSGGQTLTPTGPAESTVRFKRTADEDGSRGAVKPLLCGDTGEQKRCLCRFVPLCMLTLESEA